MSGAKNELSKEDLEIRVNEFNKKKHQEIQVMLKQKTKQKEEEETQKEEETKQNHLENPFQGFPPANSLPPNEEQDSEDEKQKKTQDEKKREIELSPKKPWTRSWTFSQIDSNIKLLEKTDKNKNLKIETNEKSNQIKITHNEENWTQTYDFNKDNKKLEKITMEPLEEPNTYEQWEQFFKAQFNLLSNTMNAPGEELCLKPATTLKNQPVKFEKSQQEISCTAAELFKHFLGKYIESSSNFKLKLVEFDDVETLDFSKQEKKKPQTTTAELAVKIKEKQREKKKEETPKQDENENGTIVNIEEEKDKDQRTSNQQSNKKTITIRKEEEEEEEEKEEEENDPFLMPN